MDRAEKRELVSTLNEAWKDTGVIVVAHYKGMTVAEMTEFRKRVKEAGGSVKVAKNKLAKLALKGENAVMPTIVRKSSRSPPPAQFPAELPTLTTAIRSAP